MFYFACCMNITFNSLLAQFVKYDVHTTRKIKSIHALFYYILLFSHIRYISRGKRVRFIYESHRVRVKVTGAKMVQIPVPAV